MSKSIISEGRTTTEAIENGLKELKTTKDNVNIKVLEEEHKKSFFSILAPRVVKVEITLKENVIEKIDEKPKREYEHNEEKIKQAKEKVEDFLKSWIRQVDESLNYSINEKDYTIFVNITGTSSGVLIGYRGETLNALQTILATIANKNSENKIKLILDIENYREKRAKVLENLAEKEAKIVIRTGKNVTLEPMSAYERKIIHTKLQENKKVETYSIGEGDNRRVVIEKIK